MPISWGNIGILLSLNSNYLTNFLVLCSCRCRSCCLRRARCINLQAFFTSSPPKALFRHNKLFALFSSMKAVELKKIVLVSCIINFKDVQLWLRVLEIALISMLTHTLTGFIIMIMIKAGWLRRRWAYKVMMVFFFLKADFWKTSPKPVQAEYS